MSYDFAIYYESKTHAKFKPAPAPYYVTVPNAFI